MLNYTTVHARSGLSLGNLLSHEHETDNMTGGGETRLTYTTDS
jgi:hypothetical protein